MVSDLCMLSLLSLCCTAVPSAEGDHGGPSEDCSGAL